MKNLLMVLCFVGSLANAQVSQRYASRIYRVGDQVIITDSAGVVRSSYPYQLVKMDATNSLVRVNIEGLSKYYQPAKILNSSGVAYSTTSAMLALSGILATVPIVDNSAISAINTRTSNVDNTADANKPVSGPQQTALNAKQATLGYVPLSPANNLSEVTPATARTNLGLGTLATQSGTFSGSSGGTNTGDETAATIRTKLGITTLSGSNTGDQDLSGKQNVLVFDSSPTPGSTNAVNSGAVATAIATAITNKVISSTAVSSTYTIDMSQADNIYVYITLTGNTTLTLSNYNTGKSLYLRVVQGGAGSFTLTFPASVRFPGGASIDWNTTAGLVNTFSLVASSTTALDGWYSKQ